MGAEQNCIVRFRGQVSQGKALLENNKLIFRGAFQHTILFRDMKSVKAVDGELHIKFPEGATTFSLGKHAEKWAHKILHPKTVMEKLGVKENQNITVIGGADQGILKQLKDRAGKASTGNAGTASDQIFLSANSQDHLARIRVLAKSLKKNGSLWIVYPKGQKHITEGDVIAAGRQAGLQDVKVVAFSATDTALKFVIPIFKR
jgi:hypothetical protein